MSRRLLSDLYRESGVGWEKLLQRLGLPTNIGIVKSMTVGQARDFAAQRAAAPLGQIGHSASGVPSIAQRTPVAPPVGPSNVLDGELVSITAAVREEIAAAHETVRTAWLDIDGIEHLTDIPGKKTIPASGPIQQRSYPGLNADQALAVEEMAATSLHLLWGPPGTGKTTTVGAAVARWLRQKKRMFVVSTSNAAVDVAVRAILKCLRPEERKQVLRLGASVDPVVKNVTLGGKMTAQNAGLSRAVAKAQERLRQIRK